MAEPDGTVSLDVVPDLDGADAKIKNWKIKPVTVPLEIDTTKAAAQVKTATASGFAPAGGARGFAVSNQSTTFASSAGPLPPAPGVARASKIIDDYTFSLGRAETTSARTSVSTTKLGGSVQGLTRELGQAASQVAPLTGGLDSLVQGLGSVAAGGFTATASLGVIAAGITSVVTQLRDQEAAGLKALTPGANEIVASLDPEKPRKFAVEVQRLAEILAQAGQVGNLDAGDKLGLGDEGTNRLKLYEKTVESIGEALKALPTDQGRKLLDGLKPVLIQSYGLSLSEANDVLRQFYGQLDQQDSVERAMAGLVDLGNETDRFGFKLGEGVTQLEQWGDSLGKAFAPIQAATSAQDAYADAQDRTAAARKKLADIESGSSDSLTSARSQLVDADRALTKAIEDNAEQQQAAFEKLQDAQDRLAAARERGAALASGGKEVPGIDRSVSRAIGAAERDVAKARRDLADARNGSDQITSAKERQAAAQKKVNDEEAKVGPNSEAARKAQEELNDAIDAEAAAFIAAKSAAADLGAELEQHPEAVAQLIAEIDKAVARGELQVDVAQRLKENLMQAAAAAEVIKNNLPEDPSAPTKSGEHLAGKPTPTASKREPRVLTEKQAEARNFPDSGRLGDSGPLRPGVVYTDDQGRKWKWTSDKTWVEQFHNGGLVGPNGGQVHDGEVVFDANSVNRLGAGNLLDLKSGGGFGQMENLLSEQNDLLRAILSRTGDSGGVNYSGMSRALADAGFRK